MGNLILLHAVLIGILFSNVRSSIINCCKPHCKLKCPANCHNGPPCTALPVGGLGSIHSGKAAHSSYTVGALTTQHYAPSTDSGFIWGLYHGSSSPKHGMYGFKPTDVQMQSNVPAMSAEAYQPLSQELQNIFYQLRRRKRQGYSASNPNREQKVQDSSSFGQRQERSPRLRQKHQQDSNGNGFQVRGKHNRSSSYQSQGRSDDSHETVQRTRGHGQQKQNREGSKQQNLSQGQHRTGQTEQNQGSRQRGQGRHVRTSGGSSQSSIAYNQRRNKSGQEFGSFQQWNQHQQRVNQQESQSWQGYDQQSQHRPGLRENGPGQTGTSSHRSQTSTQRKSGPEFNHQNNRGQERLGYQENQGRQNLGQHSHIEKTGQPGKSRGRMFNQNTSSSSLAPRSFTDKPQDGFYRSGHQRTSTNGQRASQWHLQQEQQEQNKNQQRYNGSGTLQQGFQGGPKGRGRLNQSSQNYNQDTASPDNVFGHSNQDTEGAVPDQTNQRSYGFVRNQSQSSRSSHLSEQQIEGQQRSGHQQIKGGESTGPQQQGQWRVGQTEQNVGQGNNYQQGSSALNRSGGRLNQNFPRNNQGAGRPTEQYGSFAPDSDTMAHGRSSQRSRGHTRGQSRPEHGINHSIPQSQGHQTPRHQENQGQGQRFGPHNQNGQKTDQGNYQQGRGGFQESQFGTLEASSEGYNQGRSGGKSQGFNQGQITSGQPNNRSNHSSHGRGFSQSGSSSRQGFGSRNYNSYGQERSGHQTQSFGEQGFTETQARHGQQHFGTAHEQFGRTGQTSQGRQQENTRPSGHSSSSVGPNQGGSPNFGFEQSHQVGPSGQSGYGAGGFGSSQGRPANSGLQQSHQGQYGKSGHATGSLGSNQGRTAISSTFQQSGQGQHGNSGYGTGSIGPNQGRPATSDFDRSHQGHHGNNDGFRHQQRGTSQGRVWGPGSNRRIGLNGGHSISSQQQEGTQSRQGQNQRGREAHSQFTNSDSSAASRQGQPRPSVYDNQGNFRRQYGTDSSHSRQTRVNEAMRLGEHEQISGSRPPQHGIGQDQNGQSQQVASYNSHHAKGSYSRSRENNRYQSGVRGRGQNRPAYPNQQGRSERIQIRPTYESKGSRNLQNGNTQSQVEDCETQIQRALELYKNQQSRGDNLQTDDVHERTTTGFSDRHPSQTRGHSRYNLLHRSRQQNRGRARQGRSRYQWPSRSRTGQSQRRSSSSRRLRSRQGSQPRPWLRRRKNGTQNQGG